MNHRQQTKSSIQWKYLTLICVFPLVLGAVFFSYLGCNYTVIVQTGTESVNEQSLPSMSVNLSRNVLTVDSDTLVYNKISKSGSSTFLSMLTKLGQSNLFAVTNNDLERTRQLSWESQGNLVDSALSKQGHTKIAYARHFYFIDFRKFNRTQPLYFNVVRDPVNKLVSRYCYKRFSVANIRKEFRNVDKNVLKQWKEKDLQACMTSEDPECNFGHQTEFYIPNFQEPLDDLAIPYFCGQNPACLNLNNQWALERAIENVEAWYPVVPVLEYFKESLSVMEHILPSFFKGITQIHLPQRHNNLCGQVRYKISNETRMLMMTKLRVEYQLYEYLKQRLLRQYNDIT